MASEKMANSRKILIVEDEPLIAWSLADMIRTMGYEVCGTVATESAAIEGAPGCDAVLMDFRLAGGGSGLAAARKIRENAEMPISSAQPMPRRRAWPNRCWRCAVPRSFPSRFRAPSSNRRLRSSSPAAERQKSPPGSTRAFPTAADF
jgi:hypothetical protein